MGLWGSINWRSRGYLPHFDAIGGQQHVVFGLTDALDGVEFSGGPADRRRLFDSALDRSIGQCLLKDPLCASIVQNELLRLDGDRYRLIAWCVMPNHVHVVIEQTLDLAGTVRRWKSWTAREINSVLKRTGPIWRREYFDRFARDEKHLHTMVHYVEHNPVAAGVVASAIDWRWSSAAHRQFAGQGPGGPE